MQFANRTHQEVVCGKAKQQETYHGLNAREQPDGAARLQIEFTCVKKTEPATEVEALNA